MKVTLLSYTPDAERIVASAARVCYGERSADEIFSDISEEKIKKRIGDALSKGHMSIFEHASYVFSIKGISRITSHQLVRHRLASYSQQSQRYVRMDPETEFVIPIRIKEDKLLQGLYIEAVKNAVKLYEEFLSRGISQEDARYILPSSCSTNIVVTMNARELLHFFALRCCKKAQWEIRNLAWKMLRESVKVSPTIFQKAGPECLSLERCPQGDLKCFVKMQKIWLEDLTHE